MRLERHGDVALLTLESGKVNAIGPSFLQAMNGLLDSLGDARAAVVVGRGNSFSAGLDLPALVQLERAQMRAFIGDFNATMLRIFELPIPLVAAVNGHAIAGGCVLALQADVRIAADREARIGLNEAQLGLGLPAVVVETLRAQVPAPSLAAIALEGRLFLPREALALGLLHEVVPEGELLEKALAKARYFAALPPPGVRQVKASLRGPVAKQIRELDAAQSDEWVKSWLAAEPVLRETVARLKK